MQIANNKKLKQKINELAPTVLAESFINDELFEKIASLKQNLSEQKWKQIQEEIEKIVKEKDYEDEDDLVYIIYQILLKTNQNKEARKDKKYDKLKDYIGLQCTRILHINDFLNNHYLKNIKYKEAKYKNFQLKKCTFEKWEPLIYDLLNIYNNQFAFQTIGIFDHDFDYYALLKDNEVWVKVTPNEVLTYKKAVNEAKGNVLNFGLKLGYFAYMASLKNDVQKITIIEDNKELIKLFKENILPQFPYQDKIEIIEIDPLEFLETLKEAEYDYCFLDMWLNHIDIQPYVGLKFATNRLKQIKKNFWIEELLAQTIVDSLRKVVYLHHENIEIKKEYSLLYEVDFLFKNLEINNVKILDLFLDRKQLIDSLSLENDGE